MTAKDKSAGALPIKVIGTGSCGPYDGPRNEADNLKDVPTEGRSFQIIGMAGV
jgi:hypothetical protein